MAVELLRDDLHDYACELYGKEGAPVDYPVRLKLAHALLNLLGTAPGKYKGREQRGEPAEFNSGNNTTWTAYQ